MKYFIILIVFLFCGCNGYTEKEKCEFNNGIRSFMGQPVITCNNKSDKYKFCQYPSVNCNSKGKCYLKDSRLSKIEDFCMPIEVIETLNLEGYE